MLDPSCTPQAFLALSRFFLLLSPHDDITTAQLPILNHNIHSNEGSIVSGCHFDVLPLFVMAYHFPSHTGEMLDCSFGAVQIPPATISSLELIAVVISVVLYERILTPLLARHGRKVNPLQRIGIGSVGNFLNEIFRLGQGR